MASNFFGSFIQNIKDYGVLRNNQFLAVIHGPGYNGNSRILFDQQKRLSLSVTDCDMPGKSLLTREFSAHGPIRRFAYGENYISEFSMTFQCSLDMFEKMYFEYWNSMAVNPINGLPKLYSEYASPWKIMIIALKPDVQSFENIGGSLSVEPNSHTVDYYVDTTNANGNIGRQKLGSCYYVLINEVYPVDINPVTFSTSAGDITKITVNFAFRNWIDTYTYQKYVMYDKNVQYRQGAISNAVAGNTLSQILPNLNHGGNPINPGNNNPLGINGISTGYNIPNEAEYQLQQKIIDVSALYYKGSGISNIIESPDFRDLVTNTRQVGTSNNTINTNITPGSESSESSEVGPSNQ